MPTFAGSAAAPGSAVALAAGQRATALLRQRAMRCGGCGAKVGASTLAQAGQGTLWLCNIAMEAMSHL